MHYLTLKGLAYLRDALICLQPFNNDTERLEYLFKKYEEMVKKDTLFAKQKKTRKKKAK